MLELLRKYMSIAESVLGILNCFRTGRKNRWIRVLWRVKWIVMDRTFFCTLGSTHNKICSDIKTRTYRVRFDFC